MYIAPAGYISTPGDCDDANPNVNPGANERPCNGIDDNCNGQIDEGVKTTYYADTDVDGYGNPNVTTQACSVPNGYVSNNSDCNDAGAAIHPEVIVLSIDGRLNAHTPTVHIVIGITDLVVVVIDMYLTITDTRHPLTQIRKQVVV